MGIYKGYIYGAVACEMFCKVNNITDQNKTRSFLLTLK